MDYAGTMAAGAVEFRDVTDALVGQGLPAVFTQTGGMCAAIEVQLETGRTLLVTDAEDSLPWSRTALRGWGVGLYEADGVDTGPVAFASSEATDVASLFALVDAVVFERPGTSTRI